MQILVRFLKVLIMVKKLALKRKYIVIFFLLFCLYKSLNLWSDFAYASSVGWGIAYGDVCDLNVDGELHHRENQNTVNLPALDVINELTRYSVEVNVEPILELMPGVKIDESALGIDNIDEIAPDIKIKQIKIDADAIMKIATGRAFKMLSKHYSKNNSEVIIDVDLHKLAEASFRDFINDGFRQYDFGSMGYSRIRAYFMNSYINLAMNAMPSDNKEDVNSKSFKSVKLDSELLRSVPNAVDEYSVGNNREEVVKNSKYSFLANMSAGYKIQKNGKPEYNAVELFPVYSSSERRHNLFLQLNAKFSGNKQDYKSGVGYRYLSDDEDYVIGSNIFLYLKDNHDRMKASFGLDVQTSLWGVSANFYKKLNRWIMPFDYDENFADGASLDFVGRAPFLPALEFRGGVHRLRGENGVKDRDGLDIGIAYSPVPAFTFEGGYSDEQGEDNSFSFALRYNYMFGANNDYLFDWNEQFRQKSASEYIFNRVKN